MVDFHDRRAKFVVKVGSDDQDSTAHVDVTDADNTARNRSTQTGTADVHEISGRRIRRYEDGRLSGYLGTKDGSDEVAWIRP